MSIKTKFLWTMLAMALLVALVGGFAVNRQRALAIHAATQEGEHVAAVLSVVFASEKDPSHPVAKQVIRRLYTTLGRDIEVVDLNKRIVADAIPSEVGTAETDLGDALDETLRDGTIRTTLTPNPGHGFRQIAVPIKAESGQILGAVILEYTSVYDEMMDITKQTERQISLAALVIGVVAALLALYIGTSIAAPLQQLTEAAKRFAAGRTDMPMPSPRNDEIGTLTTAFRGMVEKRRQAEEALRQIRDELEVRVVERTASLTSEIAERKQAEQSLKGSEQRFRQIAENIQDVFWIVSPDWQELLYVSPAFESIWGRTCASVHEKPTLWFDAINPEDIEAAKAGLEKSVLGEAFEMTFRITRPDGDFRWIHSRGFPVHDEEGNVSRIVGLASDITGRKQMELKLMESGKLETVGRLAGGIAHDFNTILTAIIGHAELIREAVPAGGPQFQSALQIGKSAARAAELTQQLLAFGRRQMLRPEALDLNATVTGSELILRRLLGESIDVHVAIKARHPWAKADAGQIQQMLVQLALNAQDAMPRGGRLTLETGDATLDENYASTRADVTPGEYVMIAITDTGEGIPEELKPRVFEPFVTTKPLGEGSGLGLSMCYGLAKQLGGHIGVYSELGRGTTFKVYLPRVIDTPAQSSPAPSSGSAAAARGTETILLVEDDEALLDLAGTVLEKFGYTVYQAGNAAEALGIAARLPRVDLLLTDVVMPKTSGKELAAQLKASRPNTKVLYTSAYTEDAIVHHGILDSGIDFLHKPYTPSLLARKVRESLDQPA